MEIRQSTATPFLDKVFDVKMTGAELAVVYAIVGQSNSEKATQAIRSENMVMESELITRENEDAVSYELFGDIRTLLQDRKQFMEGY